MNLTFRPVEAADYVDFCLLMAQLSEPPDSRELFERQVERASNNPDMYLMAAMSGKMMAGSLIGLICEDFCGSCRPILFIENVIARAELQGRGIGRQMFEEIEAWGKTRGCNYSVLVSGLNRVGAHRFYRALGYEEAKGYKKYL